MLWFFFPSFCIIPEKLAVEDVLDDPSLRQNFDFATFRHPPLQWGVTWHQPMGCFLWPLGDAVVWTKSRNLVAVPCASSLCWSCASAGSGTNELHSALSQECEHWKSQNSEAADPTEHPLEAEFAPWMVICLTFPFWGVTFVNYFCLQMERKNFLLEATVRQIKIHLANNWETFGVLAPPAHSRKKPALYTAQFCFALKTWTMPFGIFCEELLLLLDDELERVTNDSISVLYMHHRLCFFPWH